MPPTIGNMQLCVTSTEFIFWESSSQGAFRRISLPPSPKPSVNIIGHPPETVSRSLTAAVNSPVPVPVQTPKREGRPLIAHLLSSMSLRPATLLQQARQHAVPTSRKRGTQSARGGTANERRLAPPRAATDQEQPPIVMPANPVLPASNTDSPLFSAFAGLAPRSPYAYPRPV